MNFERSNHTIASNDEKLIVFSEYVFSDIGEGGNNLLLRWQFGGFLEFKITNGS
jgi:hypothetical protein